MRGMRAGAIATLVVFFVSVSAGAQTLDAASQQALTETLKLLRDPALRDAAIAGSPQAGGIDRQIQSMAGSPELTQEIYELAAEIFSDLTRGTGGDVGRMSEALERARTDPAAFAAMLSPSTLARLQAVAGRISDRPR